MKDNKNYIKNTMNESVEKFVKKLQEVGMELYEEYSSLDIDGIVYTCPLTDVIDTLYEFSIKDINETIKENEDIIEEQSELLR